MTPEALPANLVLVPRKKGQKDPTGSGLVRGLRLEPELAQALRFYAEKQAEENALATGEPTAPNMASAARDLLRRGLATIGGGQFSGAAVLDDSGYREGYFRGLAEVRRKIAETIQR